MVYRKRLIFSFLLISGCSNTNVAPDISKPKPLASSVTEIEKVAVDNSVSDDKSRTEVNRNKLFIDELKSSAEQGDVTAQVNLGVMYFEGKEITQNYFQAAKLFQKAADQGSATAQSNLGWMYSEGLGVVQSDTQAFDWYQKAADQGNAEGQAKLGLFHVLGRGVEQSDSQATKWFQKAADQGNADAQHNLGLMYLEGRDVEQSDSQAIKWFQKAAEQGSAAAQSDLGWMYLEGRGIAQSDAQAAIWIQKAADQGNANAQSDLAFMYFEGRGVAQSESQAATWLQKAADQGNAIAQYGLGRIYIEGRGVFQDYRESLIWLRKASAQGHANAQADIGFLYANGFGVPKSTIQALHWYEMSANNGNASAAGRLGSVYEYGLPDVPKNIEKSRYWYGKQNQLEAHIIPASKIVSNNFTNNNNSASNLYNNLKDAVYFVQTESSTGSAVAISKRYLATNCHVVESSQRVEIRNKLISTDAEVVSRDVSNDACVIRAMVDLNKYVRISTSNEVSIGDPIYTIGSPRGIENTFSNGIVSNVHPESFGQIIQFTAPISPGSSGGGLFNENGELVGVTTLTIKDSQALNIAIPSDLFIQYQ